MQKQRAAAEKQSNDAERALWIELENLRISLTNALEVFFDLKYPGWRGHPYSDQLIYMFLSPLFYYTPTDLVSLEKWISDQSKTFTSFLDDIYKTITNIRNLNGSVPQPPKSGKDLLDGYDSVGALRKARDDARDAYANYLESWQAFKTGKAPLATTSFTRRANHTFWLSTADNVTIHLLRHDDAARPRELGTFTLAGDGRAVTATSDTKRWNLSRQTPRHSSPSINSYEIKTSKHKGLDLEGLPNLLGRVHQAHFYSEHWWGQPITGDSPRPFFIGKSNEVEVALPLVNQTSGTDASSNHETDTSRALFGSDPMLEQKSFGLDGFVASLGPHISPNWLYCFEPFNHPFVHSLIKRLERDGVDGLLTTSAQNPAGNDGGEYNGHFDTLFNPAAALVAYPYSPYDVDFRPQGSYSPYNWELFFHVPYLVASRLMQDARYDDARRWLHYIFDPTTSSKEEIPARFWKLQPFRENTDTPECFPAYDRAMRPEPASVVNSVMAQIDQWNRYPADPHRIARLRTSAYQKAIVFKYLDNLIAWADSLFTQDTIESINQATQLYVFASHLLGPRPQHVPQKNPPPSFTYGQLRGHLDEMSDMVAEVESMLHPQVTKRPLCLPASAASSLLGINHFPVAWQNGQTPNVTSAPLAFCVPPNTKLLTYFDTIDDRLFKIRHCMNIEGVVQQLPLFQPPIDPALLVRAAAMGLDISSILSDLSAPLPFHRFAVILQKALELCAELKSLGGQLLSALEKQDAEALALLRATHDASVLKAVLQIKTQQVKEAETNQAALQKSRDITQAKYDYYASREYMNAHESSQISSMQAENDLQTATAILHEVSAASAYEVPTFSIGPTGMGVHGTADFGGLAVGGSVDQIGEGMSIAAQALHSGATIAGIQGGFDRRQDDWGFQKDLATREFAQIDQQLAATAIRIAMANLEVTNQQLQIDNAQKIEDTLRTKYTNTELYSWMVTQISTTYYQAYKVAYDLAKRAERCYQYELGVSSSNFIQFGYWDSLRKGLFAGERLALDLKRMDASYLQTNRREYEITRQISLVLQDPQAFVDLRRQGWCEFDLPEEFFDADYPGHYFRRIKSVGLTLPCVAGPYTPINCTLTLLSSHVRTSALPGSKYPEENAPNDSRFSHNYGAIQSVATSHGQNDTGLFEVNFRDERYLPFEGTGAVSRWRIELPPDCNAFDFDTLADVVIKLSYTARDGGKPLADAARHRCARAGMRLIRRMVLPDDATPSLPGSL